MRHIPIKSICCISAAAAVFFTIAGCRAKVPESETAAPVKVTTITVFGNGNEKPDPVIATSKPDGSTVSETELSGGFPSSGDVGGIKYKLISSSTSGGEKTDKGYYVFEGSSDGYPYAILVAAGQFNTGGHDIKITDIRYDGSEMTVTVRETEPAPTDVVPQVISYPTCAVELSALPVSIKVVGTNGLEYRCIFMRVEPAKDRETLDKGKLIAWFCDGAGEIVQKTHVYELSDGRYRYENIRSTTVSWGATEWTDKVVGMGVVNTREEIVAVAKKFCSCGYVMYPGDGNKPHSPSEFLADKK